jgi:hypothetical protein
LQHAKIELLKPSLKVSHIHIAKLYNDTLTEFGWVKGGAWSGAPPWLRMSLLLHLHLHLLLLLVVVGFRPALNMAS